MTRPTDELNRDFERHSGDWHEWSHDVSARNNDGGAREILDKRQRRLVLADSDAEWLRDALTKAIEERRYSMASEKEAPVVTREQAWEQYRETGMGTNTHRYAFDCGWDAAEARGASRAAAPVPVELLADLETVRGGMSWPPEQATVDAFNRIAKYLKGER